jgi:rubredoxin
LVVSLPLWKCSVCNYIYEGTEPPANCPKCGAPRERFTRLSEEEEKLVLRSRYTNALHMEIYTALQRLAELAEKGIQDNLDPPCVKIFSEVKEFSLTTMQKIKAELETHMKKGKWG